MAANKAPSAEQQARLAEEQDVIDTMIGIYCRGMKHEGSGKDLCASCADLRAYTFERNRRCPFLLTETKTYCQFCETHCYSPERRQAIIEVMRYAGPRMLWHRPMQAFKHLHAVRKHRKTSA